MWAGCELQQQEIAGSLWRSAGPPGSMGEVLRTSLCEVGWEAVASQLTCMLLPQRNSRQAGCTLEALAGAWEAAWALFSCHGVPGQAGGSGTSTPTGQRPSGVLHRSSAQAQVDTQPHCTWCSDPTPALPAELRCHRSSCSRDSARGCSCTQQRRYSALLPCMHAARQRAPVP